VQLVKVYRQEDQSFVDLLNRMRFGKLTAQDVKMIQSRVGASIVTRNGIEPTIMCSLKSDVERYNQQYISSLQGQEAKYQSETTWKFYNKQKCKQESVKDQFKRVETQLRKDCPVEDIVYLKKGAQVILVANINVEEGLVNGARGIIVDFAANTGFPLVQFTNGKTHLIQRHEWSISVQAYGHVSLLQVPLRIGRAITIHKSQSMSLDCATMCIDKSVFEYGQGYVAFSRIRNLQGLSLIKFDPHVIRANPKAIRFYKQTFS
jgi:ATP-dependent DNA helicase PIF1